MASNFIREDRHFVGEESMGLVHDALGCLDYAKSRSMKLRQHYGGGRTVFCPSILARKVIGDVVYVKKKAYEVTLTIRHCLPPSADRHKMLKNVYNIVMNLKRVQGLMNDYLDNDDGPGYLFDDCLHWINATLKQVDLVKEWATRLEAEPPVECDFKF
jgi:hypothetical protein